MSVLSEMMYGDLADAQDQLNTSCPTLEETQGALSNAIGHILQLQKEVAHLRKALEASNV